MNFTFKTFWTKWYSYESCIHPKFCHGKFFYITISLHSIFIFLCCSLLSVINLLPLYMCDCILFVLGLYFFLSDIVACNHSSDFTSVFLWIWVSQWVVCYSLLTRFTCRMIHESRYLPLQCLQWIPVIPFIYYVIFVLLCNLWGSLWLFTGHIESFCCNLGVLFSVVVFYSCTS